MFMISPVIAPILKNMMYKLANCLHLSQHRALFLSTKGCQVEQLKAKVTILNPIQTIMYTPATQHTTRNTVFSKARNLVILF